jgi:peptide deformylase
MMLPFVAYPDPVLLQACLPVEQFGADLQVLVDQMVETMYAGNGVGLAAPQVGVLKCIMLVDPSAGEATNELQVLVNPRVIWRSPEVEAGQEGCLSLPGVKLTVLRSLAVDVVYHDLASTLQHVRCTGLRARIMQHEADHLAGTLMLERVGKMARKLALKDLPKKQVR